MIGLKLTCMKFLLAGVLSFIVFPLVAADRYSVATGNWNSTSTWSATHGGASGASIPTSSDIVYIDNGYTVTVDAASACQSIQIGGTTSGYGNGTIVFGGSFTLTVSGIVTIGNSAAGTTGSINMSSGTLACTGFTVNNGGTWTYGTGTIQLTANNTLPTSWLTTFYRLTVSAGTTTNNGNITVNNALSGAGGLTQAANATLNLGGTSGITTLTATASGNTVNYSGAAQTVHANNYYNLILSGSAAKTLQAGTTTIGGNLTLNGTATVTTVAGLTISGNLAIGDGTTFTAAGFALTVSGTATIGAGTSGLLSISSATAAKTFTGLVTVAPGATWNNSGNSPVTIRGGITNNGTFTAGSGIYTFDTNAQALTGTLSIPSITVTTITLTNNNTLTVGTALSGTGGLTQAVNATLNLGGTSGITTLTATASGNTVNFTGASQSVNAASYYNLTISGSSASAAGNIVVAGTLALTSGVLSIGPNTLS
ncbi:MAG: hypothetical protein Q8868_05885, partial [Bacteroidota bacterium]|nr:hypothetical protein [Bacteroidota bacterium]